MWGVMGAKGGFSMEPREIDKEEPKHRLIGGLGWMYDHIKRKLQPEQAAFQSVRENHDTKDSLDSDHDKEMQTSCCSYRPMWRMLLDWIRQRDSNNLLTEYYALNHRPRGVCMVISNEDFLKTRLTKREGTQEDVDALSRVFRDLGFIVNVKLNRTAEDIRRDLQWLRAEKFETYDALVVCVLSHGGKGCIFGADGQPVSLQELTEPFRSKPSLPDPLTGKPKLFFIQACQGNDYQRGSMLFPVRPSQDEENGEGDLEDDAAPLRDETVPLDADFLLGIATVPECRSFRNTATGSIYIQTLCKQLMGSAQSSKKDDIFSILTRVNGEVSKGVYKNHKQMPELRSTLTKNLVLKYV